MRKDSRVYACSADQILRYLHPGLLHCGCFVGTSRVRTKDRTVRFKNLKDAVCSCPSLHHLRYLPTVCYELLWVNCITKDSPSSIEGVRDEKPDWSFQESSA